MMRSILFTLILVQATRAAAHPGHLAEVAGHGHLWAGVAIGAAIAIGLLQGLRGKKSEDENEAEADGEEATA